MLAIIVIFKDMYPHVCICICIYNMFAFVHYCLSVYKYLVLQGSCSNPACSGCALFFI